MSLGVHPLMSVTVMYTLSEGTEINPMVSKVVDNVSKLNSGFKPPDV